MSIHLVPRQYIETHDLPGKCAVICMADTADQLANIKDKENVGARLNLLFNDAADEFHAVRPPTLDDAKRILRFVNETRREFEHLVIQCQVGIGRSAAVSAALLKLADADPRPVLRQGTYNRKLYRLLLEAGGASPEPEPLVSLAVRVKYAPDRLQLFLLSMRRQRHDNWEVVAVTDGPNAEAVALVDQLGDSRVRLIQTEKRLGQWGHPHRQLGLDACRGEFIGMSNDDNYYVPGYIEQMLHALEEVDLALCQTLHSYFAWRAIEPGQDLGCWIARASLVRQVPWPGNHFLADRTYIDLLKAKAGDRVATIERALFVHN